MTILRIGNRSAFTLIEVLLTVTILAIGMIGVLRAYTTMINATEAAQYSIDAACLLKAQIGRIEEDAIIARGVLPCAKTGSIASDSNIRVDSNYPNDWEWSEKVVKANIAAGKIKKEPKYYLNEVTLTVINASRNPAKSAGLVTYMRSVAVDG